MTRKSQAERPLAKVTSRILSRDQHRTQAITGRIIVHARRIFVSFLNGVVNRPASLRAIGFLNLRSRFLSTIFVMYPATESLALQYVYPRNLAVSAWRPQLGGVFLQNGRLGLVFFVSSTESMFEAPGGAEGLRKLHSNAEKIKKTLRAEQLTFSGILPMLLARHGLRNESPEAEVTVRAVVEAEAKLRDALSLAPDIPIVVLGGRGFVGSKVVRSFAGRSVFVVDRDTSGLPKHLKGTKTILVNLSRNDVLDKYVSELWRGVVILNEVYPPPRRTTRENLASAGVPVWHLVGLQAKSFPPFPAAYNGGIPCCAGMLRHEMRILLRQL